MGSRASADKSAITLEIRLKFLRPPGEFGVP